MQRIDDLHRGNALLHGRMRRPMIAFEGEFHILCGDRLAVVEWHALAQDEIIGEPVFRDRPRFRQAGRLRPARHVLGHGIVQCIQQHIRRDDAGRLGRIHPGGSKRYMDPDRYLPLRLRAAGRLDRACRGDDRGK